MISRRGIRAHPAKPQATAISTHTGSGKRPVRRPGAADCLVGIQLETSNAPSGRARSWSGKQTYRRGKTQRALIFRNSSKAWFRVEARSQRATTTYSGSRTSSELEVGLASVGDSVDDRSAFCGLDCTTAPASSTMAWNSASNTW